MTGMDDTTVSPWNCMTSRNTPCVDGCCGPRFNVSRPSPTSSTSPPGSTASNRVSPRSRSSIGVETREESVIAQLRHQLAHGHVVEVGLVVLAHGEADKVVRQQDLAQVRVAEEADAHHLVRLAFHVLGTRPDG